MFHFPELLSACLLWLFSYSALAEIVNIDNHTLSQLVEQGVPVIDVRRPDEWQATGMVANSHKMMFFDAAGNYDAATWLGKMQQVAPDNQPVVLICQTGARSSVIANWLSNRVGVSKVYNVTDGISRWIAEGLSVSKSDS